MTHKVYVVTDLGPGDGGKGGVVHTVAKAQRAHTIIKRGGAQGSHGVATSHGEKFAFSQWGCGTFDGIPTHLSDQFIVSPDGLLNEADALRYEAGVNDPFAMLTADAHARVATPFHGIASHLFELARADHPRGTIGTGVGQAYRDATRYPELALTVGDLKVSNLYERLRAVRDNIREYVWLVVEDAEFLRADSAAVRRELELLADDGFIDYVHQRFVKVARLLTIVDHSYFGEVILPKPGVAIIETSHGVLTDRVYGFYPHTSAIRTLPSITRRILDDADFDGQIVNLGVTRAYAIRHGAGPMPTDDPSLSEHLLPGSHKADNRWQGNVRVGALDGVLLRYAIKASGGPTAFDGLAVTWFDQIVANGMWRLANRYEQANDSMCFTLQGELRVYAEPTDETQAHLTHALSQVRPETYDLPIDRSLDRKALYSICAQQVQDMTDIPVRMVSFGPTERDKVMQ